MKAKLQKKLFDKYPKLFRQKDLPMTQTCMCWGIDTGEGWYDLIDILCSCIQNHVDNEIDHEKSRRKSVTLGKCIREMGPEWWSIFLRHPRVLLEHLGQFIEWFHYLSKPNYDKYQVEATQVKEKYGTLRFYTNREDDFVSGVISMAEGMSSKICEDCGAPGKIRLGGWIVTRCDECYKRRIEGA